MQQASLGLGLRSSNGEMVSSRRHIAINTPEAQGRWSLWVPQQQPTADALYRLRLNPGSQANMTLLARAT